MAAYWKYAKALANQLSAPNFKLFKLDVVNQSVLMNNCLQKEFVLHQFL